MSDDRSIFADQVQVRLKRLGHTQADLAQRVDVSPQFLSQLIKGKRPPPRELLVKIARELKCDPTSLDPTWKHNNHQVRNFSKMQGIEIGYLAAGLEALSAARTSLLQQTPQGVGEPGAGKADAKLFDAVTERAIANILQSFNPRCAIITEEAGIIGEVRLATSVCYIVDPFDRSRPFMRALRALFDPNKHQTLQDIVSDPKFEMRSLEAPFGSITCVREGEIVFNAMLDYASGLVYVACRGFIGYANIDDCPDPYSLAARGTEISFSPRLGKRFLCFTGDPDKDRDAAVNEQSSKYAQILDGLGFEARSHVGLTNPGGPARVLYISDLHSGDDPSFILSNGEKIFEFLGWLAFAVHSQELAVFELFSVGFEVRGNILQAPPPNYSAFLVKDGEFRLNPEKITDLDPPGHYRGAIALTHAKSTVACASMQARRNCRQLYLPGSR